MADWFDREPLMEVFIFETLQLVEELEQIILLGEKEGHLDEERINEVFRIMHTIKGSAGMMMYEGIASLAHTVEDLFAFLRQEKPIQVDFSHIFDLILGSIDFIKQEVALIQHKQSATGEPGSLVAGISACLEELVGGKELPRTGKEFPQGELEPHLQAAPAPDDELILSGQYQAVVFFQENCEMENIRSFNILHKLGEVARVDEYWPADILDNPDSVEEIRGQGFRVCFSSNSHREEIARLIHEIAFIRSIEVTQLAGKESPQVDADTFPANASGNAGVSENSRVPGSREKGADAGRSSLVSVDVHKLDLLMDMVGELVITESMVSRNPDLAAVPGLDGFNKASRQHRKVISEIQDIVMSIRMLPLAPTFQRLQRVVRDMSKKLGKEVKLVLVGEETEVDKSIIEQLSDPLMHLVRNAIDHGIESPEERITRGKSREGHIILEARNHGKEVWIMVRDDGGGLDREKILARAYEHGLLARAESELTDREVFATILLPGFSTREEVNEFSGRGVGMDVVAQNLAKVGGEVFIDSLPGAGTTITLKIPLTLAIIDGMVIQVGKFLYIMPMTSIREAFRPRADDLIIDPAGNEIIMVRGECFPVYRLHEILGITTERMSISDGIVIIVNADQQDACLFADTLVGEQQVVVKPLPRFLKKIRGISGCTLMGDGTSSLIIDVAAIASL